MPKFYPENIIPKASDFGRRIRKKGDEFVRKVLESRNSSAYIKHNTLASAGDYPCIGPCIDEDGNPVWVNFTKSRIAADDMDDAIRYFDVNVLNKPPYGRRSVKLDDIRMDPLSYTDDKNVIVRNIARSAVDGTEDELSFGTKMQKIGKDGVVSTQWTYDKDATGLPSYLTEFKYESYPDFRSTRPMGKTDFRMREAEKLSKKGRRKPYITDSNVWHDGPELMGRNPDELFKELPSMNWGKYYDELGRFYRDRLEIPGVTEYPTSNVTDKTRFMLEAMEKADRKRVSEFMKNLPLERMGWRDVERVLDSAKVRKYDNFPKLYDALHEFDARPFDSKFTSPEYIQRMHERILKSRGGK